MTVVSIIKSDNSIEFLLVGHANYASSGPDIVCAAISMATQMTMIGLDDVVHAKYEYKGDEKTGFMHIKVHNIMDDATWALVNTLEASLKVLASQYPENIQILTTLNKRVI